MDAGAAVMILVMCSSGNSDCMEIRSERSFETAAVCRDALPATIGRLTRDGRTVSGHCETVSADLTPVPRPDLDPIVTCGAGSPDTVTVHVTRPVGDRFVTSDLSVPTQHHGCG